MKFVENVRNVMKIKKTVKYSPSCLKSIIRLFKIHNPSKFCSNLS